jgi:hypothetical protein
LRSGVKFPKGANGVNIRFGENGWSNGAERRVIEECTDGAMSVKIDAPDRGRDRVVEIKMTREEAKSLALDLFGRLLG